MRALAITTLILVALLAMGFAFADGGPKPQRPQPGTRVYAPVVESWSFVSAGIGTEVGGALCSDEMPCDAARLAAAAAAGHACAADARVWLATAPRETPALRDVSILVSVVAWSGAGESREEGVWNSSVSSTEFALPWDNGWWWRQEAERIDVAFPAPCDTRLAKISINVRGRGLGGDEQLAAQTAQLVLLPEQPHWPS